MSAMTVIQSIDFLIVTYNDALDNRRNSRVKQVLATFLASICMCFLTDIIVLFLVGPVADFIPIQIFGPREQVYQSKNTEF